MATTPAPQPSGFSFASILPLFELAANVTLTTLSAAGVTPANSAILAAAIENAINPLINAITNGTPKTADVLAGYGALIGVLNALKQNSGLAPEVLAKVDAYIVAAQNGTTGYLAGATGYDPTKLAPVTPIA